MIVVPPKSRNIAFIILNSKQPLLNQIFAAAHEYYHNLVDLEVLRKTPHVCSLSNLNEKSEQKASRFAAELLLPEEALRIQVDQWLSEVNKKQVDLAEITELALLCHRLTIKYGLPLKAVLYRIFEEGYITWNKFETIFKNYDFIKSTFKNSQRLQKREVSKLLGTQNPYIYEIMYEIMPKALEHGYISLDKLEKDTEDLLLDKNRLGI